MLGLLAHNRQRRVHCPLPAHRTVTEHLLGQLAGDEHDVDRAQPAGGEVKRGRVCVGVALLLLLVQVEVEVDEVLKEFVSIFVDWSSDRGLLDPGPLTAALKTKSRVYSSPSTRSYCPRFLAGYVMSAGYEFLPTQRSSTVQRTLASKVPGAGRYVTMEKFWEGEW